MYCGFIVTLNYLRPHPNADKLQIATVFNEDVVVDLSYSVGQKCVYFPSDGQLGIEFCEVNNLVRKKDENGNNIGGYLDPNKRNVKAIKLRGVTSDGLLLHIQSLSTWCDINKLEDGQQITILNKVEICRKYIPQTNKVHRYHPQEKKKKSNIQITYPYFLEHVDTQQLRFNTDKFKVGDLCTITLKMHGCFVSNTRIRLNNRKTKKISQIKVGDKILGYDFYENRFKETTVTNVFCNSKSNEWQKIKFSRDGLQGDKRGYITCTPNHEFWDNTNKRWIEAKDLVQGMEIDCLIPSRIYTNLQKEILIGCILGDGCLLSSNNKACMVKYSSKEIKIIYFLEHILNGCFYRSNKSYISGYGTKIYRGKTYQDADLYNKLSKSFTFSNKKGENKLKKGIIEDFSIFSMLLLYLGDGSLLHNDFQKDRAEIAICDYTDEDSKFIVKCFEKFNIFPVLYKDPKGYNRLRLNTKDAYKMFNIISKYIPNFYRYKLPEEMRNSPFEEIKDPEEYILQSYVFSTQKVLENYKIIKKSQEFDLETDLHNYVVGINVVHNTSNRTANCLEITNKTNIFKQILHLPPKKKKTWKMVSGTRRVVLQDFSKPAYYEDNLFRKKYHDYLADKLPKGMTIYSEIVGWIDDDTTIMSRCDNSKISDPTFKKIYGDETIFSYGCDVGKNSMYVYRITMTNEDGVDIELSWSDVQIWCAKLGLQPVPTFESFFFTTIEDLWERVYKYYDGPDPIGKTHIREGVVVRIENREHFTAYKHKNDNFKILEGIMKENSTVPDIEEEQEVIAEEDSLEEN